MVDEQERKYPTRQDLRFASGSPVIVDPPGSTDLDVLPSRERSDWQLSTTVRYYGTGGERDSARLASAEQRRPHGTSPPGPLKGDCLRATASNRGFG